MSRFEYPIRVYPHHTDYGGIVWHGAYVAWLEEARVEVLRQMGLPFEQLVDADVNLVVADMTLTYRRPLRMGMDAVVLLSPSPPQRDSVALGIRTAIARLQHPFPLRSRHASPRYPQRTHSPTVTCNDRRILRRDPGAAICWKYFACTLRILRPVRS